MANFYAKYPATSSSAAVSTVQGEGTAGTPVGGILTVQGDPAGTPIPVTGSISATNPSVGATGAAVPASGTYAAMNVAGNLVGVSGTVNGLKVDVQASVLPTGAATQATLASLLAAVAVGRSYVDSVRNAYGTTPVTTGAWVELIAATPADINQLFVFDSSGRTLELGVGAAAAEARVLIIPPGGIDGAIPLHIPSGSRVSVQAISANATTGELDITGLS